MPADFRSDAPPSSRSLPCASSEALRLRTAIASWRSAPGIANMDVSFLDVEDWRRSARSCPDLSLFGQSMLNIRDAGQPERDADAVISANICSAGLAMRPVVFRGAFDGD